MGAKTAKDEAVAAVQSIFDRYHLIAKERNRKAFDLQVMRDCKILEAGAEGSVVFELEITEDYSNLNDVMHGGAAGVIFDMCTTTALGPLAKPGYWYFLGGVTRTLNISYLKAIPIGTTVHIRSHVVQHGRTMALIRGAMTSTDGKTTYATVEHHKVNIPVKEEHLAARIAWDEEQGRREKSKL
ncbi:MAG: hypothetical protein M1827_002066 [Pycnora praestabilis]|nr:MAG: hypothetical protein M1827_002066 [Pycnora praestabilis]